MGENSNYQPDDYIDEFEDNLEDEYYQFHGSKPRRYYDWEDHRLYYNSYENEY